MKRGDPKKKTIPGVKHVPHSRYPNRNNLSEPSIYAELFNWMYVLLYKSYVYGSGSGTA
jgi:hypothetical protein